MLRRRRVPALAGAGDGGFTGSTIVDLGRYLGSAEVADLGRRVDPPLVTALWGVPFDSGLLISSVEDRLCCPETLLRVTVFASGGLFSRFPLWGRGRLSPPIDVLGAAAGCGFTVLRRREASLAFLGGFSSVVLLLSLLLTPAMIALPTDARVKDWRREEDLVGGLEVGLGLRPSLGVAGMLVI